MVRAESVYLSNMKLFSNYVPKTRFGLLFAAMLMAIVYPSTTGMESSIIGTINSLPQYKSYFNINNKTLGLNSAATWIGYFISTPFIQQLCDYLGRKKTIFMSVWIMCLGIGLSSGAVNTTMFVIGRIIIGLAAGCMAGGSNTLVGEMSPPNMRGFLMGLYHSSYYIGSLIASGITYGTRNRKDNWSWRIPLLTQLIPVICCLILVLFCPESPRWLMLKGHKTRAEEILYILNDQNAEKTESLIVEIEYSLVKEKELSRQHGVYARQFKSKANLQRMFISLSLALMCELAGSSVATYYFSILLESAGVTSVKTQLKVAIIRSAWCFVCALTGCATFDTFGRKKQAFFSMCGIIVCMFILGGLIKQYGKTENTSGQYGAIAMMFLFSGFYSYAFTPLLSIYSTEIYSNAARLAGVTIFHFFDYSAGIFGTFMLPIGMSNMGWKFYVLNASYDLVFLPMIYFAWVETKNMPLEEIPTLFGEAGVVTDLVPEAGSSSPTLEKFQARVETRAID